MSSTNIKPLYCFLWLPSFWDFVDADAKNNISDFIKNIKDCTAWAIREKATQVFWSKQQQDTLAEDGKYDNLLYTSILLFIDEFIGEDIIIIDKANKDTCYYQWQDGESKGVNGTGLADFAEEFAQKTIQIKITSLYFLETCL
jgi:hypothetical protein